MHPLRASWIDHVRQHPRARTLNVADALGVSEAELLFSRVGDDATLLRSEWAELLAALPELGTLMCLVRNAHVVHEKVGPYETVRLRGGTGGVFGEHIDQRLFVSRWCCAIAAPVERRGVQRRSLQIFDGNGVAALKLYARAETDLAAWDALVERFADDSPPDRLTLHPFDADRPDGPDHDVDVQALRSAWAAMTDTHQAHPLLRRLGVGRVQALRLLGPDWATTVRADALAALLQGCAESSERLMIFVGNDGVLQIHVGRVQRTLLRDGWFNVLDPAFNLHVLLDGIHEAWVVRKPTDRGLVWSLECFDNAGRGLLQCFGERTEDRSQRPTWHAALSLLAREHALTLAGV